MPKTMKNGSNNMMLVWVVLLVIILFVGLLFYKSNKYGDGFFKDSQKTGETEMIEDTKELEEAEEEIDQVNIDVQIDSELDSLDEELNQVQE